MKLSDFYYDLPKELIAQYPTPERTGSRLLVLDRGKAELSDRQFPEILDYLNPNDLLVFNNTRVIPARLFGEKSTGGKVELLVERILSEQRVLAHIRSSKSPKPGTELRLAQAFNVRVLSRHDDLFECEFPAGKTALEYLEEYGHLPLPPYIDRCDEETDAERYQTVYAKHKGAVAAPTAGLHFDTALLAAIKDKGIASAFVTLHVGAGTFQPVRVDNILEHKMHAEWLEVSAEVCEQIAATKSAGGRVFAVGTTTVRCLETAALKGELQPYSGDTNIFIYPGFKYRVVDALLTNFHLPESTLVMLVSAFAGRERIMHAYAEAVARRYRFFSYGDAMLIL